VRGRVLVGFVRWPDSSASSRSPSLSARRRILAKQIADEFGVGLRTVHRDVKALEVAGFPLIGTAGDGYRMAQDAFLRPLQLAPDEAEALVLVGKAGRQSKPGLRRRTALPEPDSTVG